eukprot:scaffold23226_cov85-Isochrysis_galbana.AAC.1
MRSVPASQPGSKARDADAAASAPDGDELAFARGQRALEAMRQDAGVDPAATKAARAALRRAAYTPEEMAPLDPYAGVMPERVSNRMIKRVVPFAGADAPGQKTCHLRFSCRAQHCARAAALGCLNLLPPPPPHHPSPLAHHPSLVEQTSSLTRAHTRTHTHRPPPAPAPPPTPCRPARLWRLRYLRRRLLRQHADGLWDSTAGHRPRHAGSARALPTPPIQASDTDTPPQQQNTRPPHTPAGSGLELGLGWGWGPSSSTPQ